jgi:hypothetical protein
MAAMDPNLALVDQALDDDAGVQLRAAYRERAHLVAALATHPAVTSAVLATDAHAELPDCATVVYLETAHGQMTWHLADVDLDLVDHLPRVPADDPRAQWDGHSTAEKYARVRDLAAAVTTIPKEPHQP